MNEALFAALSNELPAGSARPGDGARDQAVFGWQQARRVGGTTH